MVIAKEMVAVKRVALKTERQIVARADSVRLVQSGVSKTAAARKLNRSYHFVDTAVTRKNETGRYSDRRRKGRPRKITREISKQILKIARGQCNGSVRDVARKVSARFVKVGHTAVSEVLVRNGVHPYYSSPKPLLTPAHKLKRLQWATAHLNDSIAETMRRVFADEKRFAVCGGRFHVWRYKWEDRPIRRVGTYCDVL